MCGRYLRRSDKQRIAEAFHVLTDLSSLVLSPVDYNIAPSTLQPVIRLNRDTGEREIVLMRWGLIPSFASDATELKALFTINARAETVTTNRLWRRPFERHRCLVPADGFYEWQKAPALPSAGEPDPAASTGTSSNGAETVARRKAKAAKPAAKKPFVFTLSTDLPFAFAGLWDAWRDPATGDWLQSFAIITTDANEVMAPVHNRMPVILEPRDYDRWLSRAPGHQPPIDLLRPIDDTRLRRAAANPAVGNVRNNGPELLSPPSDAAAATGPGDRGADGGPADLFSEPMDSA